MISASDLGHLIQAGAQLARALDRSGDREQVYRLLEWVGRATTRGDMLAEKLKQTEQLMLRLRQEKRPPTADEWQALRDRERAALDRIDELIAERESAKTETPA